MLRHQLSANIIAVLIPYLLVVQAIFSGLAQGAMAVPTIDTAIVICSSHGPVTVNAPGSSGPLPDKSFRCPCATVCQLGATAVPVVFGGFIGLADTPSGRSLAGDLAPAPPAARVLDHLTAEARAPPVLSV